MTTKHNQSSNSNFSSFYECHFPLIDWIHGTTLLNEMVNTIAQLAKTLQQLHQWKIQGLIFPKPTLSSRYTFVFWVEASIIDSVLAFPQIRGGLQVQEGKVPLPDSSSYKGKKQTPRPRRILLDVGCDSPLLINQLKKLGLEVVRLWDYADDLVNYEVIEICTSQYIDLLVSTNDRLLMPPEEWLEYLMPHRTRMYFPPKTYLGNPKVLVREIYKRAYTKRKFKTRNRLSNKKRQEERM